jgi:hypothetical protein
MHVWGTHKIHRLSAHYRKTIYSVVIEGNLRVLFYIEGDIVKTLVIGTHDSYRWGKNGDLISTSRADLEDFSQI